MVDSREGEDRGKPGEMRTGGVSPVIGDIEETTTSAESGESSRSGARGVPRTAVQVLRSLNYPLARDDMVREAAGHGAESGLLDLLVHLPARVYGSADDVAGELQRSRPMVSKGQRPV